MIVKNMNNDCIIATENLGKTVYINVCNGYEAFTKNLVVPWGTLKWFMFIIIVFCFFLVLLPIGRIIYENLKKD